MKLLGGTLFALDGCKLKCNASPQWSRTVSELRAKRQKLEEKAKELLKEQEEEDRKEDDDSTPPENRSHRGNQIENLKKQADRIETWLKENGERLGVKGKEIKSNMTDNASSKMITSNWYCTIQSTEKSFNTKTLFQQSLPLSSAASSVE